MLKSMYAGVSGMRAHQSRMDVIGNNIANVNTYGFKASRATFRDMYYQTTSGAGGATANRGGTNPSQIGYGSKIGSIDVLQTRSSFTMTDNGMDLAIAGEGFFQVQDGDGNIFYTRAGILNVDASGNLVDINGNFVLGVSDSPIGQAPSSNKITLSVPPVNPSTSSAIETINSAQFTFSTSNSTIDGNVSLNFISVDDLPLGQAASAEITSSGITIKLNKNQPFTDITQLNQEINNAITNANGGVEHPAGVFTVGLNPASKFPAGGLTGEEIASKDFSPKLGSIDFGTAGVLSNSIEFNKAGTSFSSQSVTGGATPEIEIETTAAGSDCTITITVNGTIYSGILPASVNSPGTIKLSNTTAGSDANDYVILDHKGYTDVVANITAPFGSTTENIASVTATQPSSALGLSSKPIKLSGGTQGGSQTVADLSSIGIGADGIIEAIHPVHGKLQLGRLDIVTFSNPQALEQAGNTYFKVTANSGEPRLNQAGTGGSGAIAAGSLEMSNVDLSREFSDMITTQRGFQANSRLITVSDEMLTELVNLKR